MSESDVMQLNVVAPNLGVFTGVIQREPEIANVMSNNTPVRVLNFDVPVTVTSHDGRNFTAYVKCSAWGEEAIAKLNPLVGHAWEKHVRVRVVGTVDASAYRMPRPPFKTIGVMRCRVLQVEELSEKTAEAKSDASRKTSAVTKVAKAKGKPKKGVQKKGATASAGKVQGGEQPPAAAPAEGGAAGKEQGRAVHSEPPAKDGSAVGEAKAKKKGKAARLAKRSRKKQARKSK